MSKILEITTLVEGMARLFLSGIATFNASFAVQKEETIKAKWFTVNLTSLINHLQKSDKRIDFHSKDGFVHMVNGTIFIRIPT